MDELTIVLHSTKIVEHNKLELSIREVYGDSARVHSNVFGTSNVIL